MARRKKDRAGKSCDGSGERRRRTGRVLQEMLHCDLGAVLDLSAGGMKVLCRRPPRATEVQTTVVSHVGEYTLKAKVIWTRRVGFGKTHIGLEFVDVDEDTRETLARIGTAHRHIRPRVA